MPKSNWANTIDEPPFEAYAVTCGLTFTFGGLKIDTSARVMDTDGAADPRPVRGRRAGRRAVLLQLSRRHRPDERRGVRQDRRHHRRAARRAVAVTPDATYDVIVVGGGGRLGRRDRGTRDWRATCCCSRRIRSSAARPPGRSARSPPAARRISCARASRTPPPIIGATWPASTVISIPATMRPAPRAGRRHAGDVPLAAQAWHPLLRTDAGAAAYQAAHAQRAAQFTLVHHASGKGGAARRRRHRCGTRALRW